MAGSNIDEFRRRLKQYQKNQRGGFGRIGGRGRSNHRSWRPRLHLPLSQIILVLALMFAMKAFIVLRIGEDHYRTRLAAYDDPGIGERIGLFIMRPDAVTLKLRDMARPIIGR